MQGKYVTNAMNNSFKENMKSIVEDGSNTFISMVTTIDNQILNESANGKTILTLTKDDLVKIMCNDNHRSYNNEIDIMSVNRVNAYKASMLAWMYAIKYYYEQQGFDVILDQGRLLIAWPNKLDDIAADTLHDYLDFDSFNCPLFKSPNQPTVFAPDKDDDLNFKNLEQTAPSAIDEPGYGDKDATQIRDRTKNSTIKFADDVKNLCISDDSSYEDELPDHALTDIQDLSGHALDDAQDLPDFNDTDNDADLPDLDAQDDTQDMPSLDAQDDTQDLPDFNDQDDAIEDNPNKMPDALNDKNNPFMSDEVPDKGPDALNDEPDPFMEDENSDNSKTTKK